MGNTLPNRGPEGSRVILVYMLVASGIGFFAFSLYSIISYGLLPSLLSAVIGYSLIILGIDLYKE